MKKLIFILAVMFAAVACNSNSNSKVDTTDSTAVDTIADTTVMDTIGVID